MLWPESACYIGTVGPKYPIYGYLGPLGKGPIVSPPSAGNQRLRGIMSLFKGSLSYATVVVFHIQGCTSKSGQMLVRHK